MTLKEKIFAKEIQNPENRYNMAACMRKAKYSKASIRAGSKYRQLRKITQAIDYFQPDVIKKNVVMTFRMAKKVKDITNMNRNLEHQAKIAGMITDKAEVTQVDNQSNQFSLDRLAGIKKENILPVVSGDSKQ